MVAIERNGTVQQRKLMSAHKQHKERERLAKYRNPPPLWARRQLLSRFGHCWPTTSLGREMSPGRLCIRA
jgi:hypothetical protein